MHSAFSPVPLGAASGAELGRPFQFGDPVQIALGVEPQHQTGANRGAVDNYRAGTAGAMLAAEMSSGQA